MSDPRPSEPGADDPAVGTGDGMPTAPDPGGDDQPQPPAPAVPAIDLSEPEPAQPSEPLIGDDPVGAPDGPPLVAGPDADAPDEPPEAAGAEPHAATTPSPAGDQAGPPLPPPPSVAGSQDAGIGAPEARPASAGQAWKMVLVVVVFLAVVVVAYLLGKKGGADSDQTADPSTSTTINTAPVSTANWVTVTDKEASFSIRHPKDWEKLPSQGDVRLLLRLGEGSVVGISARDVDSSVAPGIIQQAMADVELLETPRDFSLNGFPAAVYIYKKPVSTENPGEGVVVHYFAIAKTKLYAMVFVVSPPEELNRLGRTISAVAETLKSSLEAPDTAATTTPTTAAGTTSTTG